MVFLIILAAAIPRGVTVFLPVYIAFLLWNGVFQVTYLLRNPTWARLTWRSAVNPIALIRQAESERHVPAYDDDLEAQNRGDSSGVELMYARSAWQDIWASSVLIVWSVLLWLISSTTPALAALISFVWLISVVLRMVLDYRLFPQVFAT